MFVKQAKHLSVKVDERVVNRGFHRGAYEMTVGNLQHLKRNHIVESNTFDLGGFKWRLGVWYGYQNGYPPEMFRVLLFSCNAETVYADVNLTVGNQRKPSSSGIPERKPKVASLFSHMDRQYAPLSVLSEGTSQSGCSLVITADLKNIRIASYAEQSSSRINLRTVSLEIISHDSINKALNGNSPFAIVPSDPKRHCDVSSRSLVHLWAQQEPDCRYWLCKRGTNGNIHIGECLNEACALTCFEDIWDDSTGGYPWVTVFKEEKKCSEVFQPIDKDTRILFCVLRDPLYNDLTYLGHILVQKDTPCSDLSTRIADEEAHLQEGQEYTTCFAKGRNPAQNVTYERRTLDECKAHSGSVLMLTPKPENEESVLDECAKDFLSHKMSETALTVGVMAVMGTACHLVQK